MVKVNWNVPPCGAMGLAAPESNDEPSSLVTVWGALVIFFQTTVVPTGIVSVLGLKVKVPLLSVVIVTVIVLAVVVGAVVAVGAGAATVAVGFELVVPPVLVEPPQAARMKRTPTMSREITDR